MFPLIFDAFSPFFIFLLINLSVLFYGYITQYVVFRDGLPLGLQSPLRESFLAPLMSSAVSISVPPPLNLGQQLFAVEKVTEKIAMESRNWLVHGFIHISSGAFQWKVIWTILQAGPLWGYQPVDPDPSYRIQCNENKSSREGRLKYDEHDRYLKYSKKGGRGENTVEGEGVKNVVRYFELY